MTERVFDLDWVAKCVRTGRGTPGLGATAAGEARRWLRREVARDYWHHRRRGRELFRSGALEAGASLLRWSYRLRAEWRRLKARGGNA